MDKVRERRGFTLVELIVVLAIVAVLTSMAVPTISRLLPGSRDEISTTAQTVFSLLKAARIYAQTHNVDTAVVYTLDNYVDPPAPNTSGLGEMITDTVTGQPVRVIRGAAIMYKNPDALIVTDRNGASVSVFMPVPTPEGNFQPFANDVAVLLNDPFSRAAYHFTDLPRFIPGADIAELGMQGVEIYLGQLIPQNKLAVENDLAAFPAHVFTPSGLLDTAAIAGTRKERYAIYVGRMPSAPAPERLINPEDHSSPLQVVPIEIYRSTGRVRVAS